MAVTIKDVANLAGVSPSTVSRTCNNNPSISKETKERVRKAMVQLGYEPSTSSSSTLAQTKIIGIILPPSKRETFENSFYLEVIRGISQFCNNRQYISTIITGKENEEIIEAIGTMAKNDIISGFIVLYSRKNDPIIDYLYTEGFIYTLIGKAHKHISQTVYIDNDNILAGKQATDYLFNLGHRKIAYIGSDSNMIFSADRKNGYIISLNEHNIPFQAEYCIELPSVSEGLDLIRPLLNNCDKPTAAVVSDDIYAFALEYACVESGLSIPKDLSIISFNNSLFARLTYLPLTSIDINSFQLGIEAASQIINHLENPDLMATKIIVPHRLIERNSCCRI